METGGGGEGRPRVKFGRPYFPETVPGKPGCLAGDRRLTLVAEKAPPAFLAVALPGLLAGAVETAGVPNALVTVPALPAHSAPWRRGQSQWMLTLPAS